MAEIEEEISGLIHEQLKPLEGELIGLKDIIASTGATLVNALIQSQKGDQGEKGEQGIDGKNGKDGKDGKNGIDGQDGENGINGKDGRDGKNGLDGINGKDGKNAIIDEEEIIKKILQKIPHPNSFGGMFKMGIRTMAWIDETPTGSINGSNTVFTLSTNPKENSEIIRVGGSVQERTEDYTLANRTITFTTAPSSGVRIRVKYVKF